MITSYEQMPYGIFTQIKALAEDKNAQDIDIQVVALLSGRTADDLINAPIQDYLDLKDLASFLYTEAKPNALRKSYKVGGYDLIVDCNHRTMKTAQYLDFQEYCKLEGDHVVEVLSCFLIPLGCTYAEGYDVVDVQNAIRDNMSICDIAALQDFFTRRLGELMLASLTSSAKMTSRLKDRKQRRILRQQIVEAEVSLLNGVGLPKSTLLRSLPTLLGLRCMTYLR